MKISKIIYSVMCTFVVTSISNASNNKVIFGNVINNLNSNCQSHLNNSQTEQNTNINNNDAETLSCDEDDDYRTKYLAECSKKELEITFGSNKNNTQYKVVVNDIYGDSSNTKNFPTIKKLASNLKNITNDLLSAQKGITKYKKKTQQYTYTLEDIEIDYYNLGSLTLNGSDNKNPSIVNLIFNTSKMENTITFNNVKCNNISKLNLSFKNSKNQFVHCYIQNIASNNNMNITSNIPLCINNNSKQYFNYSNNSVDINIGTGNNVIKLDPFYNAIQKFNEIILNNMYGNSNISEVINKYYKALEKFPSKNEKYYFKAQKLNIYKYRRAIEILKNLLKVSNSGMQVLKYFFNVHKIFSNDLYNVLK